MGLLCVTQVPVGRGTLGRIINVIGEPVDECGPVGEHRKRGGRAAARRLYSNKHQPMT